MLKRGSSDPPSSESDFLHTEASSHILFGNADNKVITGKRARPERKNPSLADQRHRTTAAGRRQPAIAHPASPEEILPKTLAGPAAGLYCAQVL